MTTPSTTAPDTSASVDAPAVLLERKDDIVVLTLNNPARRNAYSAEMKDLLMQHFTELMADKSCGAIVLTGAGGNFCAGGDVKQMRDRSVVEMRQFMALSQNLIRLIVTGPKPVIAAVEGLAFGAGLALACASDHVVAARNARFCAVFMRIALLPDVLLRWTLSQRVGPAKAQELITLADEFDGESAHRLGVANRLTESGGALEEALRVARRYADLPSLTFALNKVAYFEGTHTFELAARSELRYHPVVKLTDDHREAVAAFKEKRKPKYRGS